jgi:exodeoxyribonuclease VII small subunit
VPPSSHGREPLTFAEQLDRLEEIVRRLESQDLNVDLDEALKLFEEGVERLREARERLTAAEAQVKQVLADRAGNFKVEDFDA